ncbi:aKG-HExxH-type peptide beta-hydroxylase [Cryptosporangium sp. NPDC048952]|uniref:aKG-HExxH-type peptide beta-hydroxylase n=1 Tax=Cryptosporangium sp. NPDC048952 TaxID=3363961 RepID=UPI00371BE06C
MGTPEVSNHRVPGAVFLALATGGADETEALPAALHSKRRLLLLAVRRRLEPDYLASVDAAWALLANAARVAPAAVDSVLDHPAIGGWGMQVLRESGDLVNAAGYFGGIVAAALYRAGLTGDVSVRVRADGTVPLPSVGRYSGLGVQRWLTASVTPGVIRLEASGNWEPVRQFIAETDGRRLELLLDDVDPHRVPDELAAAERLADEVIPQWQASLRDAWDRLVRRHPHRAASIARDVTSLTPLITPVGELQVSASSSDRPGGVALTKPASGSTMAETLVHEHQHLKLASLLALVPLTRSSDRLFYAPWRTDPRPALGLLHGAYAHLGLVQYWAIERDHDDGLTMHYSFARWRQATALVLDALSQSDVLTDTGVRFVAGMREALAPHLAEPVPAVAAEVAEDAERENRISWRLRNVRPDENVVLALADAWRHGRPYVSPAPMSIRPVAGSRASRSSGRQRLAMTRLISSQAAGVRHADGLREADLAYSRGDHANAARLYGSTIRAGTAESEAWVGLALAHHHLGTPAGIALVDHPALVRALHEILPPSDSPEPEFIADWIATGAALNGRRLDH